MIINIKLSNVKTIRYRLFSGDLRKDDIIRCSMWLETFGEEICRCRNSGHILRWICQNDVGCDSVMIRTLHSDLSNIRAAIADWLNAYSRRRGVGVAMNRPARDVV